MFPRLKSKAFIGRVYYIHSKVVIIFYIGLIFLHNHHLEAASILDGGILFVHT